VDVAGGICRRVPGVPEPARSCDRTAGGEGDFRPPNGPHAKLCGQGPRAESAAACRLPRIPLDSEIHDSRCGSGAKPQLNTPFGGRFKYVRVREHQRYNGQSSGYFVPTLLPADIADDTPQRDRGSPKYRYSDGDHSEFALPAGPELAIRHDERKADYDHP
jgi:hypothetical protein